MSRWGSRVAASDMTTKVTCQSSRRFMPAPRDRILQFGGKILDTRTRLQAAMPADLSASSNEVSFSRCLPTPLVKNISLGTNPSTSRSFAKRWIMVNEVPEVRKKTMERQQRLRPCRAEDMEIRGDVISLAVLTISPI